MDLVAGMRKQGSRGGVNFSWDDVATSAHRENYLGHSLKAPVGRWQKGKDLNWYAKADDGNSSNETAEEKMARERKEELQKIKEAEEDALARALGLPVAPRNTSGANAVEVEKPRINPSAPQEVEKPKTNQSRPEGSRHHHRDSGRRHRRRHRSTSPRPENRDRDRDREREEHRERRRDRSPRNEHHHRENRDAHRRRDDNRGEQRTSHVRSRNRSRSLEGGERRYGRHHEYAPKDRRRSRSRSPPRYRRRSPARG
ncbi:kinase phosphorylation protein-domain-containing protein [Poronia punctata]|nr:kinase phosphorylation protein-domain-containing protein [Poronia punctata]